MTNNPNVIDFNTHCSTEAWKVTVANKVNEIRMKRELVAYNEAMQQVFFTLVEMNFRYLGIYAALLHHFVLESKKIA